MRGVEARAGIDRTLSETRPKTLLVVDDEPWVIKSIKRSLRREDMAIISAQSGPEALDMIKIYDIGVVLSDQMMPGMDGVCFLNMVRQYDPHIVRLLLTGYASVDSAIDAINRSQIFEYLTKPWETDNLKNTLHRAFDHYALNKENQRLQKFTQKQNLELQSLNRTLEKRVFKRTRQLADVVQEGILMLSMAAEARDNTTGNHVRRIQNFTADTCRQLGLSATESQEIAFFSMMHDVGKIHIPDHILKKKSKLTDDEWRIMKTHTLAGEKILGNSPHYEIARRIARSHHEWIDGSGYPDGLSGNNIPYAAKIVAVVDVFDALTNERSYKKAWSVESAIDELKRLSGKQFEAGIVAAFITVVDDCQRKGWSE